MKLIRTLCLLAFCILWFPSRAEAIPIRDIKTTLARFAQMLSQFTDAYFVMAQYRDAALDKAKQLMDNARQIVELRRKYEQLAVGELAAIGKGIPDWREYSNICNYSANGVSVCNIDRFIGAEITRVMNRTFSTIERFTFSSLNDLDREIRQYLGGATSDVLDQIRSRAPDNPLGQWIDRVGARVRAGEALEGIAHLLSILVDTTMTREHLDRMVSSGRANQLVAHLSLAEAEADIAIAHSRVAQLRSSAFDVLERLAVTRIRYAILGTALNRL